MKKRDYRDLKFKQFQQVKRDPLWFQVSTQGNYLIVNKAKNNRPSVNLSRERKISFKDFEFVYSYYDRWLKGEMGVRHEVSRKSRNTAYIFALIAEANKTKII